MPATVTVRERLAPEITSSLFANYRSPVDAIQELVDNAVDSRLRDSRLVVELRFRAGTITFTATGGEGMDPAALETSYLRWGGSQKRGRNLLGRYGQGGKAAIGHLGAEFTVEASRPGAPIAWRFSDPDYRNRSRLKVYELFEVQKPVAADLGYVRIEIRRVDKRIDQRRLAQKLGETYRPLILGGAMSMTIDGATVGAAEIVAAERQPISVNAGGARVTGWYGLLDLAAEGRAPEPGIRCYRLGRLIAAAEFFGHGGPAVAPGLVRLTGEVEIPHVPLTMNKSDFDRGTRQWEAVADRMNRLLAPIVRRLSEEPSPPPPQASLRVAEKVSRLLGQALRLADRDYEFGGIDPAPRTRRKRDGATLPLPLDAEPANPDEPAEPRRQRQAGRGLGRVVVRPLDEVTRSRLLVEGDSTLIVINSRHPLFVERKGDMWYQLESAAREVCRAREPESVVEFERRVNDLLVLAFQLRRRRRPAPVRSQLELRP